MPANILLAEVLSKVLCSSAVGAILGEVKLGIASKACLSLSGGNASLCLVCHKGGIVESVRLECGGDYCHKCLCLAMLLYLHLYLVKILDLLLLVVRVVKGVR